MAALLPLPLGSLQHGLAPSSPKMVVGILSALRKPPTVISVAQGLVRNVDRSNYALLVWQAFSASHDHQTKHSLEELGFTVFTQQELYPELGEGRLQITLGDTKERMLWRAGHGEGEGVAMVRGRVWPW